MFVYYLLIHDELLMNNLVIAITQEYYFPASCIDETVQLLLPLLCNLVATKSEKCDISYFPPLFRPLNLKVASTV